MWRMANYTITGWKHYLDLLDDMAVQFCPLPAFAKGEWSPSFWKEPTAIVQRYAALNSGLSPLLPTRSSASFEAAAELAHKTVETARAAGH
eukprot:8459100-Pyramimonas_sp.AAC.1